MGNRIDWPKERQAYGGTLVHAIPLSGDVPDIIVSERLAADALFWVAWGAEQVLQAAAARRDPAAATRFLSETHPEVGGKVSAVLKRYGMAFEEPELAGARTVYFGTMGLLREIYQSTRPTTRPTNWAPPVAPPAEVRKAAVKAQRLKSGAARAVVSRRRQLGDLECDLGAVQLALVVGLTVFGIASVWAGAWYGASSKQEEEKSRREIEGVKAAALAKTNAIGDAVRQAVAAGQPVDLKAIAGADFSDLLKQFQEKEERSSWAPWAGVGGLVVGGTVVGYATRGAG